MILTLAHRANKLTIPSSFGHLRLIGNQFSKFVELKFVFLVQFDKSHVSQIFRQRDVPAKRLLHFIEVIALCFCLSGTLLHTVLDGLCGLSGTLLHFGGLSGTDLIMGDNGGGEGWYITYIYLYTFYVTDCII